ncbi:MAG: DUF4381 domain-containing protein [Methylococcaceae bacterium]|nr:MAG: DUF4381 domain-containing protein [Methylococcaceae bacterium]
MPDSPQPLHIEDIHLPAPIGVWPPAPGWWLLLPALVLLGAMAYWLRKRRFSPRRLALYQLDTLEKAAAMSDSDKVKGISVLLRRACITVYGRPETARLTGEAWLEFLDQGLKDRPFSQSIGRVLLDAPYQPDFQGDLAPLFRLCRRWLKQLPTARS